MIPMHKIDLEESQLLQDYEQGQLQSIASKSELAKFKAAARATALKTGRLTERPPGFVSRTTTQG